ncbi:MAG: LptF/LptG family permease [Bacteroidales bacterium]|nr:LptF/LptG family permease [Bacteroidales bacterium]
MRLHYPLIDRYILGKYIKTFLLWLVLIIVIVITFDVSEKLDDFLKNNAPVSEIIFRYYANFIPNFFNLYGPLFVFISTLFFTSKMAGNTEIIAILGSGISYRRMLRPYLHGALILALGIFVVGNFVIPRSNIQLKKFEDKYIHTHHRNYYSNLHFQTAKGVQVTAFSYDVGENSAIFFQQDSYSPSGDLKVRICANKIIYDTLNDLWTAQGMTQRVFDGDKETLKTHAKAKIKLPLKPDDFNEAAKEISTMNSIELYHHIQHEAMRGSGAVTAAKLEYYQRLLNPLAFLVMTFIGVAISSRKVRGGIGLHLAIGITLAFGFIVLMRVCSVFAENGNLQPFLAVLLPQLIFGIAAIYLIKKAPK